MLCDRPPNGFCPWASSLSLRPPAQTQFPLNASSPDSIPLLSCQLCHGTSGPMYIWILKSLSHVFPSLGLSVLPVQQGPWMTPSSRALLVQVSMDSVPVYKWLRSPYSGPGLCGPWMCGDGYHGSLTSRGTSQQPAQCS